MLLLPHAILFSASITASPISTVVKTLAPRSAMSAVRALHGPTNEGGDASASEPGRQRRGRPVGPDGLARQRGNRLKCHAFLCRGAGDYRDKAMPSGDDEPVRLAGAT